MPDALLAGQVIPASWNFEVSGGLDPGLVLNILVEFNVFSVKNFEEIQHTPLKVTAIEEESRSKLCQLLASIEMDDSTADVTLKSKDGVNFPAHRVILSGRSPVFREMFRKIKNAGRPINIIEMNEIDGSCLKVLLHFIYTGGIKLECHAFEILWGLTYAAHKYKLSELLQFLDHALPKVLMAADAAAFLVLVSKANLKNAEKELFDMIKNSVTDPKQFVTMMERLVDDFRCNLKI